MKIQDIVNENNMSRRGFLKGASAVAGTACGLTGCGGGGGLFGDDAGDECNKKIQDAINKYGNPEQIYSHTWSDGSWSKDLWWYSKGLSLGFQVYVDYKNNSSCNTDSYTFRPY